VFWKALPEHNPEKLDSTQDSYPIADGNLSKINHTHSHINYYNKDIDPKIVNPVGHAR
jgi:hypothetical protein